MKFAKFVFPVTLCDIPVADSIRRELEQELVPEWRAKYLDYKVRRCQHI
jgi:SPX domain.